MGFLSFKFVLFLGLTFFAYFAGPYRLQWLVLLLFSLLYYYLCSHKLIVDLIAVSLFTFLMGKLIDRCEDKKKRKLFSTIGIIGVLSNLIVIKYSDFIIENINALIGGNISLLHFVLSLGISYYTLQAISYLKDVEKKRCPAESNPLKFMLYLAYFPQIIQGPIPKYKHLASQLYEVHEFDYERITRGLQLMFWGIAKKIILADRIATPVTYMFEHHSEYHGFFAFFAAVCYGFQIYADFSGGIDAMRGISEVLGINLDQNFRQPFYSRSVEEFWRRWHISLGAWMKEYVFYPLSLSKGLQKLGKKTKNIFGADLAKKFAPFVAMFVTYLLVGLWHGPQWKYVVYGIWNGFFIMNGILFEKNYKAIREKLKIADDSKAWAAFQMFRTFVIVSIGRIISRSVTLKDGIEMLGSIFHKFFDLSFFSKEHLVSLGINGREWILCLIVIVIILFFDHLKEKGMDIRREIAGKNIVIRWTLYLLLLLSILIFGKYGPGYDAANFIYGKF
ncbi:MAG: MBOAT family protein [Erysipelotrichaceae bacterium]|nr:MBOAT family protein [Erysipelotrichaceae bacterium]